MNGEELLVTASHAFYIAWAYGFAALCIIVEIFFVRRQRRTLLKHLSLMQPTGTESFNETQD